MLTSLISFLGLTERELTAVCFACTTAYSHAACTSVCINLECIWDCICIECSIHFSCRDCLATSPIFSLFSQLITVGQVRFFLRRVINVSCGRFLRSPGISADHFACVWTNLCGFYLLLRISLPVFLSASLQIPADHSRSIFRCFKRIFSESSWS